MKKYKYLLVFLGIVFIFILIYLNSVEQKIEVQKYNSDQNSYEEFKVITNNEDVRMVKEIIQDIKWENKTLDRRPSDYRFSFQNKNPKFETKVITYDLWISPDNESVELAVLVSNDYSHLDKSTSAELVEILLGEKLSDLTPNKRTF